MTDTLPDHLRSGRARMLPSFGSSAGLPSFSSVGSPPAVAAATSVEEATEEDTVVIPVVPVYDRTAPPTRFPAAQIKAALEEPQGTRSAPPSFLSGRAVPSFSSGAGAGTGGSNAQGGGHGAGGSGGSSSGDDKHWDEDGSGKKLKPAKKPLPKWVTALVLVGMAAMLATGILLMKQGTTPIYDVAEMPLPEQTVSVPKEAPVAGPVGTDKEVPVKNGSEKTEKKESMKVADMAPMTVFVPAAGTYSSINGSEQFVGSDYNNLLTLKIPDDPRNTVWYSGGAALASDTDRAESEGTTFLAAHVSSPHSPRGAFEDIHKLKGGEMVYTKDDAGHTQAWKVTDVYAEKHKEFPQEYWLATGKRQLVIATCGGSVNQYGYYQDNIFTIAVPVDMPTPGA